MKGKIILEINNIDDLNIYLANLSWFNRRDLNNSVANYLIGYFITENNYNIKSKLTQKDFIRIYQNYIEK